MPNVRAMPIRCVSSSPISTAGSGADWRKAQAPPRGPRTDMTRDEALAILGLASGATEEEIRAAHRRLILRVHPDAGGSADLAARINRAKDVLLGMTCRGGQAVASTAAGRRGQIIDLLV